jgi:hypothetical protein
MKIFVCIRYPYAILGDNDEVIYMSNRTRDEVDVPTRLSIHNIVSHGVKVNAEREQ